MIDDVARYNRLDRFFTGCNEPHAATLQELIEKENDTMLLVRAQSSRAAQTLLS